MRETTEAEEPRAGSTHRRDLLAVPMGACEASEERRNKMAGTRMLIIFVSVVICPHELLASKAGG
jgi:hypothetical protein